jgi:ABC-type dipeptide/oligopeptide/nickel transport system permease component
MKQQLPFIKSSTAIKGFEASTLAKSETSDCVVLSIATAFSVSYEESHEFVKHTFKRKFRKGTNMFAYRLNKYAETYGELFGTKIIPMGVKTSQYNYSLIYDAKVGKKTVKRKMTVGTFIKNNPIGTFIVVVTGHAFTIIDGVVIGNYSDAEKKKKIMYDAWEIIF